jgi:4-amino-4-deoxy-L-arabinose transferase-like glycosyltransferase
MGKTDGDQLQLHVLTLLALCALLFFPFLGARDFWELENRYAEVIRVMWLDGDYLVPRVNGEFFTESPPLFFWFTWIFCWIAGGVGEWPIRLPSALSATELVFMFYLFVRKRLDARLAILSSIVLAASVLTVHVERHVPVNTLFYVFISAAMFFLMEILVFDSERYGHAYGAWISMALACLTNGPLGVLFPVIAACVFLSLSRRWSRVRSLRLFSGAFLFFVVTLPWLAYLAWKEPADWLEPVLVHLRFSGHRGPDHQAFFSFPLAFAPWCFLFIPVAMSLWRERSKIWQPAVLFFFVWFALGLFFSEISFGRHNHYLFLAYIPAALGIGVYLVKVTATDAHDTVSVWTNYSVIFFCFLLAFGGISGPVVVAYKWPFLAPSVTALGLAVVILAAAFFFLWRLRGCRSLIAGFAAFPVAVNLLLQSLVFPDLNTLKLRGLAEKVGAVVASSPAARFAVYEHNIFRGLNYYSGVKNIEILYHRGQVMNFLDLPGSQLLLLRRDDYTELSRILLKTFYVVLAGNIGPEQWVVLSSCKEGCDRPAVKLDLIREVSSSLEGAVAGDSNHRGESKR